MSLHSCRRFLTSPLPAHFPQYLAENGDLLDAAHEKMCLGRLHESLQYQLQLQQNLIYLATHADEEPHLEKLVFLGNRQPQQPPASAPSGNGNADGDGGPSQPRSAAFPGGPDASADQTTASLGGKRPRDSAMDDR